ncbi:membrane bound O-acyl transferase family-domain-containing protein [Apodospora peruviana]|uniref:Membrane bound O-acyl transferase family-domain-containing protein n=1 Tax=Apodospora peruviana TaxID=516989 RepID=A0AAE0LY21_9PEZI|nr:membrane bound O-acyl transferase family-domain-containing protein [Apodospora peruviana]
MAPWLHVLVPFSLALTSQTLTALAFTYTASDSILRIPISVGVVALTWQFHQTVQDVLTPNQLLMALLTTGMWIQCIKTFDDLSLTRISVEKQEQWTTLNHRRRGFFKGVETTGSRISWALVMLWNARGIGTPWQIDRLPVWAAGWVPSRRHELSRHTRNFVICYFVLDVFAHRPPPDLDRLMAVDNQSLFSRLCCITTEEVIFRFAAVSAFWLNTFCLVIFLNSIFSVLYLLILPVEMVPPIYGKLSDTYTLRNFWGHSRSTWHQTLRRPLTSISNFFIYRVFRLPPSPRSLIAARYLKLFISFGISGAIHQSADLVLGISRNESQAFVYFVTTAAAITFEDGVQYIFSPKVIGQAWRKYVGYIWVCGYMYWMTPACAYPAARVVRPT